MLRDKAGVAESDGDRASRLGRYATLILLLTMVYMQRMRGSVGVEASQEPKAHRYGLRRANGDDDHTHEPDEEVADLAVCRPETSLKVILQAPRVHWREQEWWEFDDVLRVDPGRRSFRLSGEDQGRHVQLARREECKGSFLTHCLMPPDHLASHLSMMRTTRPLDRTGVQMDGEHCA